MAQPYPCVFGTIGPAREEWGDAIMQFTHKFWQAKAVYEWAPILKFETGNDGYPHFHIALAFSIRQSMGLYWKGMRKFLSVEYANDKPKHYNPETGYSFRLFAVPTTGQQFNTKVLRGRKLVEHYLDEPTKEKSTDGKHYTLELEGFNAYKHIEEEPDEEIREKKRKWLLKYQKLVHKGVDLPPLDLLQNVPHGCIDMDQFASRWQNGPLHPKNAHKYANGPTTVLDWQKIKNSKSDQSR